MLTDLGKLETNIANYKDGYARMKDREEVALRILMNKAPSKITRVDLDKKRRAEMVADNTAKFGNQTIGIHGGELPKFSETRNGGKSWW